ncbi:MerR family transcriptional regulator [Sulfurimonas sp. MAG313]|nr:MerR family transcriptional regulator [Sulfurimonas sp. MAG313]MDF1880391.1 MerR family transcriptional regulator [Sulfurimonas sp. MAG313]
MSIKMASLMKETGETRSTLLFYVKEGLLEEPSKPKPNVHLYTDDSIDRVRLIKTLQHQLHYSITQIKQIFDDNQFDFSSSIDVLIQKLDLFTGVSHKQYKSMDNALEVYHLSKEDIEEYIELGMIDMPQGFFNDSSWRALEILNDIRSCEKSWVLLKAYVKAAKDLSVLEYELGAQLIEKELHDDNHAQELFLDLVLTLKPYIFNLHTKLEHKRRCDVK